jgi:hypothetical protein
MSTEQDYEVINARVKQKIDTEANWIAGENTLGPIFQGEQAFVQDANGNPVNFKIGDGMRTFSQLPYFIAYYTEVTSQKVLGYIGNSNITIGSKFKANSLLTDIVIYNSSGSIISLEIGITNGGNEICSINVPNGANSIGRKYAFTDVETLYLTGITGLQCAVFLLYIQLDENPAIPPSQSSVTKFPSGFVGIFEGSTALPYESVWDFATGLAKLGFGYDNCVICGSNNTAARNGAISIPYTEGDTLLQTVGAMGNRSSLSVDNLQPFIVKTPINRGRYATVSNGSDHPYGISTPPTGTDLLSSQQLGLGTGISIQNYAIKDLWFKAIS